MTAAAIIYPGCSVLLTSVVGVVMFGCRVAEMRGRRIHPQEVAAASQMMSRLEHTPPTISATCSKRRAVGDLGADRVGYRRRRPGLIALAVFSAEPGPR